MYLSFECAKEFPLIKYSDLTLMVFVTSEKKADVDKAMKWQAGVYQVFITNKNTGAETTEKAVVTRR